MYPSQGYTQGHSISGTPAKRTRSTTRSSVSHKALTGSRHSPNNHLCHLHPWASRKADARLSELWQQIQEGTGYSRTSNPRLWAPVSITVFLKPSTTLERIISHWIVLLTFEGISEEGWVFRADMRQPWSLKNMALASVSLEPRVNFSFNEVLTAHFTPRENATTG